MSEVKFEIKENLGVIAENSSGWKKELNLVSWNENEPKYDIRDWNPEHTHCGKGITLTKDELMQLVKIVCMVVVEPETEEDR